MLLKCLILLLCSVIIHAYNTEDKRKVFDYDFQHCPYPNIKNGYGRLKQRGNLVRFSCRPRYILMGNRYATCRGGQWDVPAPNCIKPGCAPIKPVKYAVSQTYHNDAWMLFFCFPGYTLVGSPVIYCDGNQWNATAPTCNDSSAPTKTSCDFEDAGICGWKQDELHDFDWRRLNRRTPSSFLLTGPQYDHTIGKNGNGYYMYIESTSRFTNDTARLISPVFDEKLTKDGCFVFYYHMYGKGIGGLRVYQKPDSMTMNQVLGYSDNGINKYRLFEQWGNQGNIWFTGYAPLLDVNDDFQIVIEGIRGTSFLSDIAIDDVAILQGANCTIIAQKATTPVYINEESCAGRCESDAPVSPGTCVCSLACILYDNCCADYLEICEFSDSANEVTSTSSITLLPQTQKLVATTPVATPMTLPYEATSTWAPTTISAKSTTNLTTTTTTSTTSTTVTTKQINAKTLPIKPISEISTKPNPTTSTANVIITSTTTLRLSSKPPVTKKRVESSTKSLETSKLPLKYSTFSINPTTDSLRTFNPSKRIADKKVQLKGSNGLFTTLIVFLVASVCCGALFGAYKMRSAAGCATLARWRGRVTSDPEVRFLNSDIDVNNYDD